MTLESMKEANLTPQDLADEAQGLDGDDQDMREAAKRLEIDEAIRDLDGKLSDLEAALRIGKDGR